jgi:CheY-like chemotaxis protein
MPPSRILIVEDQREVSRLLHSALDTLEERLEIDEIPSGEEAILDSSRNQVDLLVTDYRLPGITGIELMQKVRRYHPGVKVILITGQTDSSVRREVADAGADAFFIKPVPIADFLDSVERHLGLVQTILPPEPIDDSEEGNDQPTLPDILAGLRQELNGIAVLLLNDDGHIVACAGDLPDSDNEISLLSSLLSIQSAGQKIAHLIGKEAASNWHVFTGEQYDMIFAPVGKSFSMLAIGSELAEEEKILKAVDSFSTSRRMIELTLSQPYVRKSAASESATTPLETPEAGNQDMEVLLKETKKKLKKANVNEFWEKAAGENMASSKPDMLSYEQAKQLGLAPEEETKKSSSK